MSAHPTHNFTAPFLGGESCARCGCRFFNLLETEMSELAQQECPRRFTLRVPPATRAEWVARAPNFYDPRETDEWVDSQMGKQALALTGKES